MRGAALARVEQASGQSATRAATAPRARCRVERADAGLGRSFSAERPDQRCDNADAEATLSTIKVEYVHGRWFATRAEALQKIAT